MTKNISVLLTLSLCLLAIEHGYSKDAYIENYKETPTSYKNRLSTNMLGLIGFPLSWSSSDLGICYERKITNIFLHTSFYGMTDYWRYSYNDGESPANIFSAGAGLRFYLFSRNHIGLFLEGGVQGFISNTEYFNRIWPLAAIGALIELNDEFSIAPEIGPGSQSAFWAIHFGYSF